MELALRRTAVADLQRIVPNTVVDDEIMVILDPADTTGLPDSAPDLGPRDLHVGIGLHDPADLVFPAPEGGHLRRTTFGRRFWTPAVERAGISPAPTFHHLRHTCAALMIAEGGHPKAIQARMGHASITTTLNTYGHLFPSLEVELAERLGDLRAARLRHAGDADVVPIDSAKP